MGMTYGWTIDYIDTLTWPTIRALMKRIEMHPPADLMVAAFFKGKGPKTISEQAGSAGLPVTKGKVKRYGDKRR